MRVPWLYTYVRTVGPGHRIWTSSPKGTGNPSLAITILSFTANRSFCLQPRYRSVVWMDTWPRRNWMWSSSPPARWQRRAHVHLRSCRAGLSIPAAAAACLTISQSTFGVMPSPQILPDLEMALKNRPSLIPLASLQRSSASLAQHGIGPVRVCPALPSDRQLPSAPAESARSSPRLSPQPIRRARIA